MAGVCDIDQCVLNRSIGAMYNIDAAFSRAKQNLVFINTVGEIDRVVSNLSDVPRIRSILVVSRFVVFDIEDGRCMTPVSRSVLSVSGRCCRSPSRCPSGSSPSLCEMSI